MKEVGQESLVVGYGANMVSQLTTPSNVHYQGRIVGPQGLF